MPQFNPGEAKIAIAPITVSPAGLSCEAELFLGPDEATKVATSGRIPFVSSGIEQSVQLPVTMPVDVGAYHVYIDILAEGLLIGAYQAIEDVDIALAPALGMISLYYAGPSTAEWKVGWYNPETGGYPSHREYYPPAGKITSWKWYYDPHTPPEPIDLNNLKVRIETYSETHTCPLTGWLGSCSWGVYGPFVVEDGKAYTLNVTTGVLAERS